MRISPGRGFLRGINSGALTEDRALTSVLTIDELRGRCYVNSKQDRRT